MKKVLIIISMLVLVNPVVAQDDNAKIKSLYKGVLKAMGGKKNYDKTNIIKWTFFGSRTHTWDKLNNKVRIDYVKENTIILLNMNDQSGKVLKKGKEVSDAAELKMYLEEGRKAWINDSYWLVMPWKLMDPGVTLKYKGVKNTETGDPADVLEMTFDKVGVTPENKYLVFIDQKTHFISQWSHFQKAADEKPRFTMPWKDYKPFGKIMLSGSRGDRSLTDIAVFDILPETVFSSFDKPSL